MGDYDVNAVDMSYRTVVFFLYVATAVQGFGQTTISDGCFIEGHNDAILLFVFGAFCIQLVYAAVTLMYSMTGPNEAIRGVRDTLYQLLAFPSAAIFVALALSNNIGTAPFQAKNPDVPMSALVGTIIEQRAWLVFATLLVELWFVDRKFYSVAEDVTRLVIMFVAAAGFLLVKDTFSSAYISQVGGLVFLAFLALAIFFRGVCQLEEDEVEVEVTIAKPVATRSSKRTSRRSSTRASSASGIFSEDEEVEVTTVTKKVTKRSTSSKSASAKKKTPTKSKARRSTALLSDDEELTELDIPKELRIDHPGPKTPAGIRSSRTRRRSTRTGN